MLHVFGGATREAFAKYIFQLDFILLVLIYLITDCPKWWLSKLDELVSAPYQQFSNLCDEEVTIDLPEGMCGL